MPPILLQILFLKGQLLIQIFKKTASKQTFGPSCFARALTILYELENLVKDEP